MESAYVCVLRCRILQALDPIYRNMMSAVSGVYDPAHPGLVVSDELYRWIRNWNWISWAREKLDENSIYIPHLVRLSIILSYPYQTLLFRHVLVNIKLTAPTTRIRKPSSMKNWTRTCNVEYVCFHSIVIYTKSIWYCSHAHARIRMATPRLARNRGGCRCIHFQPYPARLARQIVASVTGNRLIVEGC